METKVGERSALRKLREELSPKFKVCQYYIERPCHAQAVVGHTNLITQRQRQENLGVGGQSVLQSLLQDNQEGLHKETLNPNKQT